MSEELVLISSLGTHDYDKTTYVLSDVGQVETRLSPLALAEILAVDRVFLPRTPEAGIKYDDILAAELDSLGIRLDHREIPKIQDEIDVNHILHTLREAFDTDHTERVVLDVTHSYRSLPMVFFASLSYLDALDEISLEGVYYAEHRPDRETSPFIDLTYLYTLIDWFYAIRSFEQTGNLRAVARLLEEKKTELFRSGEQPRKLAAFTKKVNAVDTGLGSGLPLETGIAVDEAMDAIENLDESDFIGPEGAVIDPLKEQLSRFELQQEVDGESDIELTEDELNRQAQIVQFYADRGQYPVALECARELFVSRVIYGSDASARAEWLNKDTRINLKNNKITNESNNWREGDTSDAEKLWQRLSRYRNYYAHAGFDDSRLRPDPKSVQDALNELCENINHEGYWKDLI